MVLRKPRDQRSKTSSLPSQDGLAVVDKLVWHLETYDVTSIRASTPMYLLSEYIQKMGIKVRVDL